MEQMINKILLEWSLRVHDGMPNKDNPLHIVQLRETLSHMKLSNEVTNLIIQNLTEEEKFYARKKEGDKISVFTDKENYKDAVKGGYKPVDKAEAEKELSKKDDEEKPDTDTKGKEEPEDKEKESKKVDFPTTKDYTKSSDSAETEEKPQSTAEKITQNQSDIFNNKVSGKGGGTTSLQEEIAGLSRKIAIDHPDDTPEQHQERLNQFIKDNYGDTKYGSNEKLISGLVKKSASGQQTMSKIKSNEGMKFDDNQPEGYPIQITFTDSGTSSVKNELEDKLKNASPEDKAHYEKEIEYFKKHATSETGVEGDGDTAMMYVDTDGKTRVVYISNKQSLGDPHANATVKSATEAIKTSAEPGTNVETMEEELDAAVKGGIDANGDMVKSFRADIDSNKEELNKSPLGKIATLIPAGRAFNVDKTSDKYFKNAAKNPQVKEYIKENNLDIDNPEHIVEAAMAVTGTGESDGLNDSTKQAANKLVFKMANTTSKVREKMQREIDKGKTPEEAAEIVTNSKDPKSKKPFLGGNISADDCLSIYNNTALEKIEQNVQTRKDAMQQAHENMYNRVVELDVAHHQAQGISSDDAIKKYDTEAGPHEQTYTKSFMKRMHWDRYIDGVDDDKKMIEIGDKAYTPKDFRNCLGELTGWDGKGNLKEHLQKNMRITPGTMKLSFVSKGKSVEIGDDTWRTAGDLSKIAGGLGKDMQKCLGSK